MRRAISEWRAKSSALERKFGSGSDYLEKHPEYIYADLLVIQIVCLLVCFGNAFIWALIFGLSIVLSLVAALSVPLALLPVLFVLRYRLHGYRPLRYALHVRRKRAGERPSLWTSVVSRH